MLISLGIMSRSLRSRPMKDCSYRGIWSNYHLFCEAPAIDVWAFFASIKLSVSGLRISFEGKGIKGARSQVMSQSTHRIVG